VWAGAGVYGWLGVCVGGCLLRLQTLVSSSTFDGGSSDGWPADVGTSSCKGLDVLGGFARFGETMSTARTFTGLPAHSMLRVSARCVAGGVSGLCEGRCRC
jgi:hypothetical protein